MSDKINPSTLPPVETLLQEVDALVRERLDKALGPNSPLPPDPKESYTTRPREHLKRLDRILRQDLRPDEITRCSGFEDRFFKEFLGNDYTEYQQLRGKIFTRLIYDSSMEGVKAFKEAHPPRSIENIVADIRENIIGDKLKSYNLDSVSYSQGIHPKKDFIDAVEDLKSMVSGKIDVFKYLDMHQERTDQEFSSNRASMDHFTWQSVEIFLGWKTYNQFTKALGEAIERKKIIEAEKSGLNQENTSQLLETGFSKKVRERMEIGEFKQSSAQR